MNRDKIVDMVISLGGAVLSMMLAGVVLHLQTLLLPQVLS